MSETREFHIGDILSITTYRLVSPRRVDGIYDILGWMTDETPMTHQLPRLTEECAPSLRAQFPDLAAIAVPDGINSEATLRAWLASLEPQYGTMRAVGRLDPVDHTPIDPITEFRMLRPDALIIPFVVDEDRNPTNRPPKESR